MKSFEYTVHNPVGLHARPAGALIVAARAYQSEIRIEKDGEKADPKNLMSVLKLNVNQNDTIRVSAEGEDEAEAIAGMEAFMRGNL